MRNDNRSSNQLLLLVGALVAWTAGWSAGCQSEATKVRQALSGTWRSVAPEPAGAGLTVTRQFTFASDRWQVVARFARESSPSSPFLTFTAAGHFEVGKHSNAVDGASDALFHFERRSVRLMSPDPEWISRLGLSTCAVEVGREVDVSETGCGIFVSNPQCAQEYDLVALSGEELRLGSRPRDRNMCTENRRPKQLGPALRKGADPT